MKKYIKLSIILIILTIFYLYIANITLMPKSITLLQGEELKLATLWGVKFVDLSKTKAKEETLGISNYKAKFESTEDSIETSSNLNGNKINTIRKN